MRCRPAARAASIVAPAAERPLPLRATSGPPGGQISQNASPPSPQEWLATTARAAFVAIAASTAPPPARRIARPASLASACGDTTAPWQPRAVIAGTSGGGVAEGAIAG